MRRWFLQVRIWLAAKLVPASAVVLLHRHKFDQIMATVTEIAWYYDNGGFGHHARPKVRFWLDQLLESIHDKLAA